MNWLYWSKHGSTIGGDETVEFSASQDKKYLPISIPWRFGLQNRSECGQAEHNGQCGRFPDWPQKIKVKR